MLEHGALQVAAGKEPLRRVRAELPERCCRRVLPVARVRAWYEVLRVQASTLPLLNAAASAFGVFPQDVCAAESQARQSVTVDGQPNLGSFDNPATLEAARDVLAALGITTTRSTP